MFGFFAKKQPELNYLVEVNKIDGISPLYNEGPIKLKKGEKYIASSPAKLCLYKNDGRIGASGFTARIPICKGLSYRQHIGKITVGKSWQVDQIGELHLTTDKIIFDGTNKNYSVPWSKVLKFAVTSDGLQIHIDRENGSDFIILLEEALPLRVFKTADKAFLGQL